MKNIIKFVLFFFTIATFAQNDSTKVYKKRVLESPEVDFLMSYYEQNGDNASVTGGIGTEELTDLSPTIVVSIPLNDEARSVTILSDGSFLIAGTKMFYTNDSTSGVSTYTNMYII